MIQYKGILKYLVIVGLLSAFSCKNYGTKPGPLKEKTLLVEKIYVNDVFSVDFMTKANNFLFISSSLTDTLIYQYSLPSISNIANFGIKGQGPDDIQVFPMFCSSHDNFLYIWGYTPLTIRKFKLADSGEIQLQREYKLKTYEPFNNMHIINDSIFVYYLSNNLTIKKYNLNNGEYLDEINMKKDDHKESYFYSNRGLIAASDSFLVYSYLFKKQIDIYDINSFKLKTTIVGNYKYVKPEIGNFNTRQYYKNIVAGKKYFYALAKNDDQSYTIEVYDYTGKPIITYKFDISPFLFVVDEDNNMLYGYDQDYQDYILKYQM